VVLINEAMARFFWQDQNAVGQILGNGVNDKNDLKVVELWQMCMKKTWMGRPGGRFTIQ